MKVAAQKAINLRRAQVR